jgi:hypothetical protein
MPAVLKSLNNKGFKKISKAEANNPSCAVHYAQDQVKVPIGG